MKSGRGAGMPEEEAGAFAGPQRTRQQWAALR